MTLQLGWMYYNDEKIDLMDRVRRASELFEAKFHRQADVCFVNPIHLTGPAQVDHVTVKPLNRVQPNTFWLAVVDKLIWTHCKVCMCRTDHERRGDALICLECERRQAAQQNASV